MQQRPMSAVTAMNGYVVPLDKAKLEGAPRYVLGDASAYTPEYGRKVHDYYGVEI